MKIERSELRSVACGVGFCVIFYIMHVCKRLRIFFGVANVVARRPGYHT